MKELLDLPLDGVVGRGSVAGVICNDGAGLTLKPLVAEAGELELLVSNVWPLLRKVGLGV